LSVCLSVCLSVAKLLWSLKRTARSLSVVHIIVLGDRAPSFRRKWIIALTIRLSRD